MSVIDLFPKERLNFQSLQTGSSETVVLVEELDTSCFGDGVLMVRVHANQITGTSTMTVEVRSVAPSEDDPSTYFVASTATTSVVIDSTAASAAGKLLLGPFTSGFGSCIRVSVIGSRGGAVDVITADLSAALVSRKGIVAPRRTWAETLDSGNTSGGTDPVLSSGDTIRGVDGTSPGALVVRGGNATSGTGATATIQGGSSSSGAGGNLLLLGGNGAVGESTAGDVYIAGGSAPDGPGKVEIGSPNVLLSDPGATIELGDGSDSVTVLLNKGDSVHGDITFLSAGNTCWSIRADASENFAVVRAGGSSMLSLALAEGGASTIEGTGNSAGTGGLLTVKGGPCTQTNGQGGELILQGGIRGSGGIGGGVQVLGAESAGANTGGPVTITTGRGGSSAGTGPSGALTVQTGVGGATSGASGNITIQTGTTTSGNTGSLTVATANSTGTTSSAGDIAITAGNSGGTGSQEGGDINITAGQGGSTGGGGDLTLTAGGGGSTSGVGGLLNLTSGGSGGGNSAGGDILLLAQDGAGTGTGGSITATAGNSATGLPGVFTLRAKAPAATTAVLRNGAITIHTQDPSFANADWCHRTAGLQTTTSTTTRMATIQGPTVDGQNTKVRVWVTGQSSAATLSRIIEQTFRRQGGTVVALTAHTNSTQSNGTVTGWAVALTISGDTIQANVTGAASTTINWQGEIEYQRGGMTA